MLRPMPSSGVPCYKQIPAKRFGYEFNSLSLRFALGVGEPFGVGDLTLERSRWRAVSVDYW
jgi:hypothetical protein